MIILLFLCGCLCFLYLLLMLIYCFGWHKQKTFSVPKKIIPHTKISILIAARNEAKCIEACIRSILTQKYPIALFEIIVVDDFSTDNTAQIVTDINSSSVRLISLAQQLNVDERVLSFKKKALSVGIANSNGALIVCTDADCIAPPNWLYNIAALYEIEHPEMIVAPVNFSCNNSLVQLFQSLDFMTMQGITAATLRLNLGIMCNGANLAFTRKAFDAVQGYEGIAHIISGDDYLLMMKIKKLFPDKIAYLKSTTAIMETAPQPNWASFFQQRIRWASKTGKYDDSKMTLILCLIYMFNVSLMLLGIASPFSRVALAWCLFFITLKTIIELIFLLPVARFYNKQKQLLLFPLLQPLHIIYIFVAGILSVLGKYSWKERVIHQK
jgi:cellulose synthase/poly-beta-1,6-N-acetylglucosamine synthase-like glycosyltransferase